MENDLAMLNITSPVKDLRQTLSDICLKSESHFISLGDILKKSADTGEEIVEKASDFVAFIEGDSGKKALSFIKDMIRSSLQDLVESRNKIVSRSDTVNTVTSRLIELQTKNNDIGMIAKHLRAVALNIFIETARTKTASENFSIIANEVKDLSEKILDLSKTIRENVDVSGKRFSSLYQDIASGVEKLEALSRDAEISVQAAVKDADDMIDNSGHVAAHAGDMGRVIFDQIGKVVVGLQFHDSMRQRIEHIGKGFSDMENLYGTWVAESDQSKDTGTPGTLHAISSVLSQQLGQIIQEARETYDENEKAFDLINQITFLLSQDIQMLVGANSGSSNQAIYHSSAITHLISALHEFSGLQNQGSALVSQVEGAYRLASETAETLSDQIGKIHEISLDAHIKSMNAIIAAMKLGDDGRTLSVLAGEMKTLSEQADAFVSEVGKIITEIVSGIVSASTEEEKSAVKTDIEVVIGNIPKAFGKVKRKSEAMGTLFEKLNTILISAFQGLSFMDTLIKDLSQQQDILNGIMESLEKFKGIEEDMRKAQSVMAGRYTMEKERKVHKNFLSADKNDIGLGAVEPDDNIELF